MSTTPIIEQLPANIPQLETNGTNWAICKTLFQEAMRVSCQWGYFTGARPCPKPKVADKPTEGKSKAIEKWEHKDAVASYLLSQRLPDITVMHLTSCLTVHDQCEMVTKEYQAKSAYTQADLHQSFLEMHCAKGGDGRQFLGNLCYKRQQL